MQIIVDYLPNFLLVFCRISGFFVTAPVFSARGVPAAFKIGISAYVSFIVFSLVGLGEPAAWDGAYVLSVIKETLLGMLLGFLASLFFTVVQIAGSFIDMQMGLGIANVLDPATGMQSPVLGNFKFFLAMLLFLSMNGHHALLKAVMDSYEWVPLQNDWLSQIAEGTVSTLLFDSFAEAFALAFRLAAPLVVAMFLVDAGLGILARTAPQFNVFIVGIPVKIIIGFAVLLLLIPGFAPVFQMLFESMFDALARMLQGLAE